MGVSRSRASALLISSTAVACLLGAASMYGCGPADVGVVDLAKSKAVAAERGVDGPGAPPAKKKRNFHTTATKNAQGRGEVKVP